MNRARPIFGANTDSAASGKRQRIVHTSAIGEDDGQGVAEKDKRQSASNKRKSALARVITKNNRKRRQLCA